MPDTFTQARTISKESALRAVRYESSTFGTTQSPMTEDYWLLPIGADQPALGPKVPGWENTAFPRWQVAARFGVVEGKDSSVDEDGPTASPL